MRESITEIDIRQTGKAPTIHDVAAKAGVSAATVSRFLNGGRVRQVERGLARRSRSPLAARQTTS